MIYKLIIEFTLDKKQKIDYNIGSVLQGIMMTFLDRDYGDELHKQSLRPYSQYFESESGKYYWIINTLTEEAKEKIIDKILISNRRSLDLIYRKSKLNIEKFDLIKGIITKDYERKDVIVNFKTPTSFKKTSGGYEIFPSVKHIFNSLINKYEQFGDDFNEITNNKNSLLENIIKNVEITGYELKTEKFGVKGSYIPGFIGKINFKIKGNKEFTNTILKLLQFGEYSGVGLKSTMGMGAISIL